MLYTAYQKIVHWLYSVDRHSLHSPFTFHLFEDLIKYPLDDKPYREIELWRKSLQASQETIEMLDYGAKGDVNGKVRSVKVSKIAKGSLSSPIFCLFLAEFSKYVQAKNVLELGTSLGIQTAYLAQANQEAKIFTLEGDPACLEIAKKGWEKLLLKNISPISGNIDVTLSDTLNKMGSVDLVYLDANHTYQATMRYFNQILPFTHSTSVLVFDDIYWSKGMKKAWDEIKNHERITLSIDLFDAGIVFLDPSLSKESWRLTLK